MCRRPANPKETICPFCSEPYPTDDPCIWCGENHPPELIRLHGDLATTCPRLGANEPMTASRADLVGTDHPSLADLEALAIAFEFPGPVAAVRLEDGSQVVAFQPHGLEVRAFGAEDLDERWVPWRQEYMCKLPESE